MTLFIDEKERRRIGIPALRKTLTLKHTDDQFRVARNLEAYKQRR